MTIHCFCIRWASSRRIVLLQRATGLQDHQIVEAALAIVEHQFVAAALGNLAVGGDHRGLEGPLADVAAMGAGVAVQGAAHGAGDADERFQSGQPAVDGGGDGAAQQGPAAGGERSPLDANIAKRRRRKADHHARHAFVANQDVRSLAQHADGDALLVAALDQSDELFDEFPARQNIRPDRPTETRCAWPAAHPAARCSQTRSEETHNDCFPLVLHYRPRPQGRYLACPQRNQYVAGDKVRFQRADNFCRGVARQHGRRPTPWPAERDRPPSPPPAGDPPPAPKNLRHQYPVGILQAGGQFVQ